MHVHLLHTAQDPSKWDKALHKAQLRVQRSPRFYTRVVLAWVVVGAVLCVVLGAGIALWFMS